MSLISPPVFFDTHAHIISSRFSDDRDQMIKGFKEVGVTLLVNVGTDIQTTIDSIALSRHHEGMYATAGFHPHAVLDCDQAALERIAELAQNPEVVAIGEIGLDYFRNPAPPEIQKKVFRDHLALAVDMKLPVVIHCRDAFDDCRSILEDFLPLPAGGEFHCYTGDLAYAQWLVSQGLMVAFNGIVTYKNAPMMREVATHIHPDYFVVETDCPYLAPQSNRGKRNDPSAIPEIVAKVAELRGMSVDEIAKLTTTNGKRLFGIE